MTEYHPFPLLFNDLIAVRAGARPAARSVRLKGRTAIAAK
jgi:hypothetical protein